MTFSKQVFKLCDKSNGHVLDTGGDENTSFIHDSKSMQFEHMEPRKCNTSYLEIKQNQGAHENNTTLVTFALFGFGSKANYQSYSAPVNVTMVTLFKRPTRRHPAELIYVSLIFRECLAVEI